MISLTNVCRRSMLSLAMTFMIGTILPVFTPSADAEVNFQGTTVEWIIPFSTGGGSDTWARFNAPFFSKYLPGNPNVIVVNEPGGGSTTGANMFASRARPDGMTFLGTSGSTQFPYLLGDPRVRYEYKDWEIAMVSPTGGVVYTTPATGVKSAEEIGKLTGQKLVYASQGATSLDLVPMLAFDLLGFEVQHVFGFKGRGDGRLAFERGEVNIDYQTSSAYLTNVVPLVERGEAIPLFSYGILDEDGNPQRDPTFPDLPIVEEVYEMLHGKAPSGPDYEAYQAFNTAGFAAQKMMVLPKGTPADIVEAYREAVRKVVKDPEYLASKEAVLGTYEQVTDRAALALFKRGTTIAPEVRERVVEMLAQKYNVRIKD